MGKHIMEIWDAYDSEGKSLGFDLIRGEAIPEGAYHLVCEVLVRHSDGTFLMMQRDYMKKDYPGKYEPGAGGSALKGESPMQGALRELREETGIKAEKLAPLYTICDNKHAIYHGYLCVTDCPKDSVVLQKGETVSYKWVDKKAFLEYMDSEECIDTQRARLEKLIESIRQA